MDLIGILKSVTKKDFVRSQLWMLEKLNRQILAETLRTGTNKSCQVTFIVDLEHLSARQMTNKQVADIRLEQTKILEANYPEILRRIFVINGTPKIINEYLKIQFFFWIMTAPKIFPIIFKMMKPLMNEMTIDKMKIFGSSSNDKEEWTSALLEEIEADQIPAFYGSTINCFELDCKLLSNSITFIAGGTMVDPDGDPKCPSKVEIITPLRNKLLNNLFESLSHIVEYGWVSEFVVLHSEQQCTGCERLYGIHERNRWG